jgi:hypothetical protein
MLMGRIFLRGIAILLLLFGVACGGIAVATYLMVGTGNQIDASGFTIESSELTGCTSFLLDVQSAEIDRVNGDFLLGDRETNLVLSTSPISNLQSVVAATSEVDQKLLGRSICVIQFTDGPSVERVSSGDVKVEVGDFSSAELNLEGELVVIPVDNLSNMSIVTSFDSAQSTNSDVIISGLIVYPQSPIILVVSASATLVFFVVALVLLITTRKKRADSSQVEGENLAHES